MAIIQISKIQQRAGDLVDLPQLDEAEFGFASDEKRLFIGKTTDDPENIEVLTSYSEVSFSQIDGAVGNLNIDPLTVDEGQVLAYDATLNAWENRGGNSGGLINLGEASNLVITGGAIGYVLQTDGTGNLSWQPKGVVTLYIENITQSANAVVTFTDQFALSNAQAVTITGVTGMSAVNGQTYYLGNLTTTTANLYTNNTLTTALDTTATFTLSGVSITGTAGQFSCTSTTPTNQLYVGQAVTISGTFGGTGSITGYSNPTTYYIVATNGSTTFTLSTVRNGSGVVTTAGTPTGLTYTVSTFGKFPYTSVTATTAVTNDITVGDASLFSANNTVQFIGTVFGGIEENKTYYVKTAVGTTLTISETPGGSEVLLSSASGTCNVYVTGGKAVATISGGSGGVGSSSNTQVLFNFTNTPAGDSKFTFDYPTGQLILTGNANVSNLHSTTLVQTSRYISNVATGTAPLTVSSTTKVANLNVDFLDGFDSSQTAVANTVVVRDANANIVGNNFSGTTISLTGNANVGNLGTPGLIVATGNITGGNLNTAGALSVTGNANVGNLGTPGLIVATGNITGGNLNTAGALSVTGNANVGNIGATNGVFTGNVTAGNVYANSGTIGASLLTGTLTTAAQPNITSVGTLTSLAVTGNVTAGNVYANSGTIGASLLTGTLTTAAQPNITSVGTLTSLAVTGNVTAGNVYANSGTIGASLLTGTLTTAAQPNVTSVGTLTSLTVSGNANVGNIGATNGVFTGNVNIGTMVTTAITTGANTTAGTITGNWTLTTGSRLESTYADLAEYYAGDKHYPAGTVLDFGGEFEVTLAGIESNRIAGVVSADPAYVMNGMIQCKHPVSIALQGRVPCKVKGKVRKGDMMISAGKGYAKAAITTPSMGTVIGKALSNFDGEEGVIEVVVGRL